MKFLLFCIFMTGLYAEEAFFRIHINKITSDKWHFVTFDGGGVLVPLKALEDYNINTDQFRGSVSKTQRIDLKKIARSIKIDENEFVIEAELDLKYFSTTKNIGDGIYNTGFTQEGKGFLFNHNTTVTNTEKGRQQLGSILEGNALMPNGAFYTSIFTSINQSTQGLSFKRMDTFWSDDYGTQTFYIGDITTHGSNLFGSTRLGGLQYGTLFKARTNFATYFQPSIQGSAAIPTTVDIYANNIRVLSQEVKAGKYDITNIPVVSGDGTLIVETTDITGKKQTVELSYFLSPDLLKEGLSEYYIEGGFRRENYLKSNFDYRYAAGSGIYRYGLMQYWTVGLSSQAMTNLLNLEIANTFAIPYVGLFTVSNAISKNNKGQGTALGVNYTKNIGNLNFGVDVNVKRGDFTDIGNWPNFLTPKTSLNTFISTPFGDDSSISFNYLRSFETTGNRFKAYTLSYRTILAPGLTFSLNGLRSFTTSSTSTKESDTRIFLGLTYTFGGKTLAASQERTKKQKNNVSAIDFSNNYNGGSYSGRLSRKDKDTGYNMRVTNQTQVGDLDFQVLGTFRNNQKSTHSQILNFSGAVGFIDDQTFVSRRVTDSMALVSVSGLPGIRIYNENRLVGKTNKDGKLIIPDIFPFQKHVIRIEEKDLPLNHVVPIKEKVVISPEYSAILVDFEVKAFQVGSFIFTDGDDYIPAGSKVKFDSIPNKDFVIGYEGLVHVNNYKSKQHKGTIETPDSVCTFNATTADIEALCVERDPPEELMDDI